MLESTWIRIADSCTNRTKSVVFLILHNVLCVCISFISKMTGWKVPRVIVGQELWCTEEKVIHQAHINTHIWTLHWNHLLLVVTQRHDDWNIHNTREEARRCRDLRGVDIQSWRYQLRFIHGTRTYSQRASTRDITRRKKASQEDQSCICATGLCYSLCSGIYISLGDVDYITCIWLILAGSVCRQNNLIIRCNLWHIRRHGYLTNWIFMAWIFILSWLSGCSGIVIHHL